MCARVYAVVLERVRVESREWEVACTRPLGVAYVVATQMCDAGVLTVFFFTRSSLCAWVDEACTRICSGKEKRAFRFPVVSYIR